MLKFSRTGKSMQVYRPDAAGIFAAGMFAAGTSAAGTFLVISQLELE